ncbi:MAG: MFS transporter [Rhodobacteraceae bacterium]|nr:MFS transporter [Paracoccaceae bacterium]
MEIRTRFGVIIGLWAAGLGAAAQFGKISVSFSLLADVYGTTGAALGFVVSLVGLVGIIFGVTAGLIVAQVGYRRALIAALVLGAIASTYQATLPSLAMLLASRPVEGASHLAIVVAVPTLISQLSEPRHRGLTLSLWSTFFGVAFAILVWFGLPLARAYGVSALFVAHSVYMAGIAWIVWVLLPHDVIIPGHKVLKLKGIAQEHMRIYRSPNISAPGLGWVCYAGAFVAILTIMPTFMEPAARSLIIGGMPLAGIASSMTLGVWLLQRIAAYRIIQIGFIACLTFSVAVWTAPDQIWAYFGLALSMGLIQGASFAAVPQLNRDPQGQAQANGALAQMGNLGTTFGTPILAGLVGFAGINGFLIFTVVLFLVGITVHAVLAHRRRCAEI